MAGLHSIQAEVFQLADKYPCFKDFILKQHQTTVIEAVLARKNIYVTLPTGYGKTYTFIIPVLILDQRHGGKKHVAVVVSPLLNLMHSQAADLNRSGIVAVCAHADMSEQDKAVLFNGDAQVIFCTPEAVTHVQFRKRLEATYGDRVCLVGIDESHCVTTWESFRSKYKDLPNLSTHFEVPFLFVTATATQCVMDSILSHFKMEAATKVVVLPDRPDIRIDVHSKPHNPKILDWVIETVRSQGSSTPKIVIFTVSIREAGKLYQYIMGKLGDAAFADGVRCASHRYIEMYHSGVSTERDNYIIESFTEPGSRIRLLVSTIRFGLGMDVSDIATVILFGSPSQVIDLWQEVGRAARKTGMSGHAVIYLTGNTMKLVKCPHIRRLLDKENQQCYRNQILGAFTVSGIHEDAKHVPPSQTCSRCETQVCQCALCVCCNYCAMKCKCPNKDIRVCCKTKTQTQLVDLQVELDEYPDRDDSENDCDDLDSTSSSEMEPDGDGIPDSESDSIGLISLEL